MRNEMGNINFWKKVLETDAKSQVSEYSFYSKEEQKKRWLRKAKIKIQELEQVE